jgi:hypothetical protein
MTKNPILNGLAAVAYIAALMSVMFYGPALLAPLSINFAQVPEIFAGITMLSLFVFSAAMMGYIFLYQPILLILAGEKKEGTTLFLKTVAAFGAGSLLFIAAGLIITALL